MQAVRELRLIYDGGMDHRQVLCVVASGLSVMVLKFADFSTSDDPKSIPDVTLYGAFFPFSMDSVSIYTNNQELIKMINYFRIYLTNCATSARGTASTSN